MGLDMYIKSLPKGENADEAEYSVFKEEAYWRKANAIHRWFVENVQNNVDDCGYYLITRDNFITLKSICDKALETREEGILPPMDGFFFGDTSYDENYWEDIYSTEKQIDKILLSMNENLSYYYHSSW